MRAHLAGQALRLLLLLAPPEALHTSKSQPSDRAMNRVESGWSLAVMGSSNSEQSLAVSGSDADLTFAGAKYNEQAADWTWAGFWTSILVGKGSEIESLQNVDPAVEIGVPIWYHGMPQAVTDKTLLSRSDRDWSFSRSKHAALHCRSPLLTLQEASKSQGSPQDVPVLGSSQVKVMFSSLSSGNVKARRMASVNLRYPSAPGFTSKLYVLPSKLTFMTAGAFAPQVGVRVAFQSGSIPSQNSQCVSFLQHRAHHSLNE